MPNLNNPQGVTRELFSASGVLGDSRQIIIPDSLRGGAIPANANSVYDALTGIKTTIADGNGGGGGVTLPMVLQLLADHMTYTVKTEGGIESDDIVRDSAVSITNFAVAAPHGVNTVATDNAPTLTFDNFASNRVPADEAGLGIALRAKLTIDNAGPNNNDGMSLNWHRIIGCTFKVKTIPNGQSIGIIGFGARGDSAGQEFLIYVNRTAAGVITLQGHTVTDAGVTQITDLQDGITGNDVHLQINDIVRFTIEVHKNPINSGDDVAKVTLVPVAHIFRDGQETVSAQFNDIATNETLDEFDFGRVIFEAGNANGTIEMPMVGVETVQYINHEDPQRMLRHQQLLDRTANLPSDTSKVFGYWSGTPVGRFTLNTEMRGTNDIIADGNIKLSGQLQNSQGEEFELTSTVIMTGALNFAGERRPLQLTSQSKVIAIPDLYTGDTVEVTAVMNNSRRTTMISKEEWDNFAAVNYNPANAQGSVIGTDWLFEFDYYQANPVVRLELYFGKGNNNTIWVARGISNYICQTVVVRIHRGRIR